MMNRWFTRYLLGVENGVEDEPLAWIVREADDRDEPTAYPDYPHPDADPVTLHLRAGARRPAGSRSSRHPTRGPRRWSTITPSTARRSRRPSGPITGSSTPPPSSRETVHLSGAPRLTIRLASSKPAANLSVWLVSLPWDEGRNARITDNIITRGWADPQNSRSLTESEPLVPGRFYELSFDLQPDDQVLREGQRIGLMLFSSDREYTLWPTPGTELTVDLDATTLQLPVVGGPEALEAAIATPAASEDAAGDR